jgi:hypothetical protein
MIAAGHKPAQAVAAAENIADHIRELNGGKKKHESSESAAEKKSEKKAGTT